MRGRFLRLAAAVIAGATTVTLIIPTAPGGINNLAGRLVARHLGRFIPGHPTIVAENREQGGGLALANRFASGAAKDGSVIAIIQRGIPQLAIQGDSHARFDPLALTWLGSLSSFALVARDVLNLNIQVEDGFAGAAAMFLAMANGDLDGQIIGLNSITANQQELWNRKDVRVLLQFGRARRHPLLPDVPLATELTRDRQALEVIAFAEAPLAMALPFVAPAGIPADRAAALQSAFLTMVEDRDFLADAERAKVDITPIDGEAVRNIIVRMAATPRDVIARYTRITGMTP